MKRKIIAAVLVVVLLIGGTGLFYISGTGHVSSNSEVVQVTVKKGENAYTVLNTLDSKGLIKNKMCNQLVAHFVKKKGIKNGQ